MTLMMPVALCQLEDAPLATAQRYVFLRMGSFLLSASVSNEGPTGASSWDSGFVSVDLGSLDNEYGNYPYPDPTGTGIISP